MNERQTRIGAYAVLYLVWGSTYLAMRFAVETLPPFSLASARFIVAGVVLLGIAFLRSDPRPTRRDWVLSAAVGALLLIGGNAAVLWAVQHVPSGVAALIIAITPVWVALFAKTRATTRLVLGLALGMCGVLILAGPAALAGTQRIDPLGVLVLVAASMSWAAGSLIQRNVAKESPLVATALPMLAGGAMLFFIALVLGEFNRPEVFFEASTRSWVSLLYLTVFGSLLGFTSYAWLMRHDEPARVATYAYVNPVIAVLLGALIADEPFTPRVLIAAVVIIAGVIVIVTKKRNETQATTKRAD